jgi:hypothetical protein
LTFIQIKNEWSGAYKETNFIFAPLNEGNSKVFADDIILKFHP